VEACDNLCIETDNIPKWKAIFSKLPPFLLEADGTLKEWTWPDMGERYNHRNISHGYNTWPGDGIDPDGTL
jgi:alpha-L-fucosidase 2